MASEGIISDATAVVEAVVVAGVVVGASWVVPVEELTGLLSSKVVTRTTFRADVA